MKHLPRANQSFRRQTRLPILTPLLYAVLGGLLTDVAAAAPPPAFTSSYADRATVRSESHQQAYAPHLAFPSGQPVQTTGPAEVTNATQLYVLFVSDSLGNTNLSDATAHTGFNLAGASFSSITGIVDPPPKPNPHNNYFVASGVVREQQAWLLINYTPGTNSTPVDHHLQVIAFDGNNNQTTNWSLTNLTLTVRPPQALPPHLEVRFYNTSSNAPGEVYILPTCKGLLGGGFWWVKGGVTNTWINWMTTTTNMTVTLADIGISGTNTQNQAYYSIFTTNFPNAAWFVSFKGGHLKASTNSSGQWDGTTYGAGPNRAQPTSASTDGLWFGHEWNAFELTLDGNPADQGNTTYINQFAIPMAMRVFTNGYDDAQAGVYTNRDSSQYYKIGGWTNFSYGLLSNLVTQMKSSFPNGVITNGSGVAVMVPGPSTASQGTLRPPWTPPPYASDAQNVWPTFASYFSAVKSAQPGRHAKIKDFIGLANTSTQTFYFYYDFDLTITASNSLRLAGSMTVTNAPGSTGTYHTNAANLVLELGSDAGPNVNWASWSIYTAPTPANLTAIQDGRRLSDGQISGTHTTLTSYSSYLTNDLGGTLVSLSGSNFLGAVQVAFCGAGNSLIPVPHFSVVSDSNLTVHVPYGAYSGPIVVTTPNGSGKTSSDFMVPGTAVQAGPSLSPTPLTPGITAFSPGSGVPAVPVCGVSGDWMAIAAQSGTGPTAGETSLAKLYNSSFGSAVMGRILGDLAAGFAFGFVNSDTINPCYQVGGVSQPYGDSPSGSWWGGNEYPNAKTNRPVFNDVNTHYSQWGYLLYRATAVTYGHPIYDRIQMFNGEYSREAIQPPVAINHNPDIWMVEIEFYDGMASVSSGGHQSSYTLIYLPRTGGTISGSATQTVTAGQNGTPVQAILADTSVVFRAWSDGRTDTPRTDTNVQANLQVQPLFYSSGGADLAWYAQYGFTTNTGHVWSELDRQLAPGKATTLLQEFLADTNPNDTNSVFHVLSIVPWPQPTVHCEPASTNRSYTIQRITDLGSPSWETGSGSMTINNGEGFFSVVETNPSPLILYRLNVTAP